jgi:6-phosphogluconolactonase
VSASPAPQLRHVLIGGFTAEASGSARGIRSLLNTAGGTGTVKLEEKPTLPMSSPSYLIGHPARPWAFAVSEGSSSTLASLEVADDGKLRVISSVATGGDGATHLALSHDGRFVLVAHYGSGSIASFAIGEDGQLSDQVDLLQFSGSGPDAERQESAHAHQVVVDGEELLVCDLGSDVVHRVRLDPASGTLGEEADPISLPGGSGPRHLVLVDDYVVVACELSAEVWFARRGSADPDADAGNGWEHLRTVATSTSGAELVQPSGIVAIENRVFVANRGADTIAVFDVEAARGWITKVAEFDCGGAWPRDLTLRDGLLWVSNERSHQISVFGISPLPPTAPIYEIASPSPARVLLLPVEEAP